MKSFIILFVAIILLLPIIAQAERPLIPNIWSGTYGTTTNSRGVIINDTCNLVGHCDLCDGLIVTKNITDLLLQLGTIVVVGFVAFGGVKMMIAGASGSPSAVSEARSTITSAIIGLVIALGAWVIVNTFLHILSGGVAFPWTQINCG